MLILSAMFRAIQEHCKWRNSKEWSVLYNTWWLASNNKYNIDGYHVSSALHVGLLFVSALLYDFSYWLLPIFWICFYQVFNLFYHVVFTVKNKRDLPVFRI